MSTIETSTLTNKDRAAIKEKLEHLNGKYGSKTAIGKIDWKNRKFTTPDGATKEREFRLESGAVAGTFKVFVAGQQAVTASTTKVEKTSKAPATKTTKASSSSSSKATAGRRATARA